MPLRRVYRTVIVQSAYENHRKNHPGRLAVFGPVQGFCSRTIRVSRAQILRSVRRDRTVIDFKPPPATLLCRLEEPPPLSGAPRYRGSDISFRGKGNAPKLYFSVLLDAYLEHLVSEIAVLYKLVKNPREKLPLQIEIQPERSVDAHKACMQANVRVFSGRPRFVRWPAKVDAVARYEDPVSFKNGSLELPVLLSCFSEYGSRASKESPSAGASDTSKGLRFSSIRILCKLLASYGGGAKSLFGNGDRGDPWAGSGAVDDLSEGSPSRRSKPTRFVTA